MGPLRSDSPTTEHRVALLLNLVPPWFAVGWVLIEVYGPDLGLLPTAVLLPLALVATRFAQQSVDRYQASRDGRHSRLPAALVQYTPGYIRFHAQSAGWRDWHFLGGAYVPFAALLVVWSIFMIRAFDFLG